MQKSVSVFIVVNLVAAIGMGAAIYFLAPSLKEKSGYLGLPLVVVPFVLAFICNRLERNPYGPFAGLTWGNTSWYFSTWFLTLLAGFAAIVVSIGLGAMAFDPEMGDYMSGVKDMLKEQGNELPESALGVMKITNTITSFCLPTIAVPFMAALGCLGTLPWYGWLGRRLLARGRAQMFMTLGLMFLIISSISGLIPAPAFSGGDLPTAQRILLAALAGVATLPAYIWIFLRTRSAVLPAMAAGSWQGALGLATFYGSGVNHLLAPPNGLIAAAIGLCAGIALWVWKDPGGEGMAISHAESDAGAVPQLDGQG